MGKVVYVVCSCIKNIKIIIIDDRHVPIPIRTGIRVRNKSKLSAVKFS